MTDVLTEVRFWAQVTGDAKRAIVCPPDLESRIKGWIDARGMSGILTVNATSLCPPGRIIVIDEPAIEASIGEWMQRPARIDIGMSNPNWRFWGLP